jgi:hypothetical protein
VNLNEPHGSGLTAEEALLYAERLLDKRWLAHAVHALNYAELRGAHPDQCSSGRWLAAMLSGDFSAAWKECDAIRARGAPDPNRFWQGEDIRGKRVILRCLHGFGDAVQFLRYAPKLRALASKLIVEVPPAMLEIARCFDGVDDVITWGEQAPPVAPQWDVQVEIIELPYLFRTRAEDLPIATNYLHLPPCVVRDVAPRPNSSDPLRIGVVWACGEWNPQRSVPVELLRPLVHTSGCEFWNLQGGPARQQWHQLGSSCTLHDVYSSCDTILKLAALIAQLDLVITPDTLAAHLAGALNTPACVMLEHASDWRWMHARTDCPWYPSVDLIRQPAAGDWQGVIRHLQSSLVALARSREERLVA